jgi:hypothetical protein
MKPHQYLFIALGLAGSYAVARADEDATAAYARGQAALKAHKIHEACEAFAVAEDKQPSVDTELAVGGCYEQDGKLVAAAKMYRASAEKDVNASRKQSSLDKATKLEARAPKLKFAINPKPDGILIKVDGMEVPTTGAVMVDVGPHQVVAMAPGYEGHASAAVDREGQTLDVILRMEATAPAAPMAHETPPAAPAPATPAPAPTTAAEAAPPPEPIAPQPHASHRTTGLVVGGVGVAALIGAGVFYSLGAGKYDDEHALCPGHLCSSDANTAKANSLRDDGRTLRGVSIASGITGVVLVAAGAYLFATSKTESAPVALHVDHHGGSLSYTLAF